MSRSVYSNTKCSGLTGESQVDIILPQNDNVRSMDIDQHCHLVDWSIMTYTVTFSVHIDNQVLMPCRYRKAWCVCYILTSPYVSSSPCAHYSFSRLSLWTHFSYCTWCFYRFTNMSDTCLAQIMKISSFTQTTIIWDALTGEAKQQFPFHSGEWQESAGSFHMTSHGVFLFRFCRDHSDDEFIFYLSSSPFTHYNKYLWLQFLPHLILTHFTEQLCILIFAFLGRDTDRLDYRTWSIVIDE